MSLPLEGGENTLQAMWEDGDRVFFRGWRNRDDGRRIPVLAIALATEPPMPASLDRLAHEFGLRDDLGGGWAVRPLELVRERGRTLLVLEDTGGEPLSRLLGQPMAVEKFLCLGIGTAKALTEVHRRGLIHKDIKPANVLVNVATGEVRLMGFGITSRLRRERQSPEPPEIIAGTLAYIAPEQTGRMNRSVDSRSDLYALGVTFYEMLTGTLPFMAADPMEWVHCHIARQPVPPAERVASIPAPLAALVMKLLAKTAEDRYQTAAGVEADLRRCLAEWESHGRIDAFPLAAHDSLHGLLIPEKLYGREREIGSLLASFSRVVADGTPELVLVSGYSGVGKSSVVNELHAALVPSRGLFASGKFDQYKRDVPYTTMAQAFQSLVGQILGMSEAEVSRWRDALREALGSNGRLIADLVPELELVIGKQPPVPELPPQDAQNRFWTVFQRFLGVFARKEHPLALFLDDLQWLDTATLDLLEQLVTRSEVRHLLLVGAYRDGELGPAHQLPRTLEAMRKADVRVQEIVLAPLGLDDVGRLVADALRCEPERARSLAQLVQEKTGGNPFFAIQFLTSLAEDELLAFDPVASVWQWDIDRIRARSYTDNVVDLMAGRLRRLSAITQEALKQLACLGNDSDVATLTLVHGQTEEMLHAALWTAVRDGLVARRDGAYKFLHDRIQQAAYSLIPEEHRSEVHLRIGRMLLASMPTDENSAHLFDVASQFNRGAARLIRRDEKVQVAAIALRAGRKAKASAAYVSACAHFAAGTALLDDRDWGSSQYQLIFSLWLERAECEFLTGNFDTAEQLIAELLKRGASNIDKAAAYQLKILLHILKSENPEALDSALTCLRLFGVDLPTHPTWEQVHAEYETVWLTLGGRPVESLIDQPLMSDPELQAVMRLLSVLTAPTYSTDFHLYCLHLCRMVNISMRHGICGASAHGGAYFGFILGTVFHRYGEGYRFAKLASDLVEKHDFVAQRARVQYALGLVAIWTQPITTAIDCNRGAFRTATETGDLATACYSMYQSVIALLLRNDPLDAVWRESERNLDFARNARFRDVADVIVTQQRFIATMQGRTATISTFSDAQFDEATFEAQLTGGRMTTMICWYWIVKLKARFLSGDYAEALASADRAQALLWASAAQIHLLDYFYYAALTVASLYENASADEQTKWRDLLTTYREQLREWADNYPPTFGDKHALVSAEIARLEGRELNAERLYEKAIQLAREHGFVQNEGLTHEVAARFYAARGFETTAHAYLRNARDCYFRWGAYGKVRQIEQFHPHLREKPVPTSPTATFGAPVEQLDLGTVLKASQAMSGEIELGKLIETLMRITLEHAGAERGLLVPLLGDRLHIEASARFDRKTVEVSLRQEQVTPAALPESLLYTVIRTQQSVILDDARAQNPFSEDEYFSQKHARSVLCLPLMKQAQLIGAIYLENNLASHVFTPARISVLELLASQAAISLENARLYNDLQEREARIRRLVDANIIGILIWERDGRILDANDAFLRIVGYNRDDLASGRLRWTELTPAEFRERSEQALEGLQTTGTTQRYEKEFFRKDGSRVPVLIGEATFEGGGDQGVAFVLDLTDRKQAEAALRDSEELWKAVFENSPTMYFMVDTTNTIISVNPFGAEQMGYKVDELIGRPVQILFHEADRESALRNKAICLEHLGRTMSWELRKLRKDGETLWVRETGRAMLRKNRPVLLVVSEDITEGKHAAEALRAVQTELAHANRLTTMGQLTASIAHEVNQPIAAARNNASSGLRFLDREPPDLAEVREALACIVNDADRAGDIIARIRDQIKKAPARQESFDINDAVNEVVELTRSEAVKNGVSIETQLAKGLCAIRGDRVQLQQVMLNLILNAIDAMRGDDDEFRKLSISTEHGEADSILVAVRDLGSGIDPDHVERVFEPFYTTKSHGMGMGLSICRSIVEAHGGLLRAGPNVPRGAVFQFTLPAEKQAS